ncbi:MAG: ribonuclease P protein component [Acidobacteria bacterium]|nr:ribonuclease P protein component [Acidobacteriota bacterium]
MPPTRIGAVDQPIAAQTLTREERIRRRPEFLRVQQRGVRTRGRYITLLGLPSGRALSRLGIVAPRRLGKAVRRNRSKRRVRELYRHHKPPAGLDLVVLPRREFLDAPFADLLDDYRRTLRRQVQAHSSS